MTGRLAGIDETEMEELALSVSSHDDSSDSDYKVGGKLGFQSNMDDFLQVYTSVAKENPERLGLSQTGASQVGVSFKKKRIPGSVVSDG